MHPLDRSLSKISNTSFKGYYMMNNQLAFRDVVNGNDFKIEAMLALYLLTDHQ
jgi:hypothetical protein